MKILVVLPRFPFPLEKGDKLRAYHQIKQLSRSHDIYLFALSHEAVSDTQLAALRPYCKEIEVARIGRLPGAWGVLRNYITVRSLQMGYWNTPKARRAFRDFERRVQPDVIYNQMVRTIPMVARSSCAKVMDFQDALSMNLERRMEQSHGIMRHMLHFEFKMLRSSEYNAFSIFDELTIISDTDADAIPHRRNGEIVVVRNGVDTAFFSPSASFPKLEAHYDLCFCGNMSYAPNVSAVRYLVEQVMPLVWEQRPQTTVLLAGAYPKAQVRSLAEERVHVSGLLPDIRSAYAAATLFVAPMQIGSGLQNKLLEAMSMHLPCITTPIANTPLGATDGQHLLVGNTPQQLADHILHLLNHPDQAKSLAEAGHAYVLQHFSWDATTRQLEQTLRSAVEKHKAATR